MILELFPTAVLIENINRAFTEKEMLVFADIEKNIQENGFGNSISKSKSLLNDYDDLSDIKSFIEVCIKKYVDEVIKPSKPLDLEITSSFSQFTKNGESHIRHTHPNSILSGVIYIQTDPKTDAIYFNRHEASKHVDIFPSSFTNLNAHTMWIPAKMGEILIFPSNLTHGVEKVVYDGTRISLAFNTWVKGEKGLVGYENQY
jgi:uncharacterized protein (TIGR02466 family)